MEIYPAWHLFPGGGEEDSVCVGYYTKKEQRGWGVMTEAVTSVRYLLFSQSVPRLLAGAFPDNATSRRVLEKCGLVSEFFIENFPTEYGTLETVESFSGKPQ